MNQKEKKTEGQARILVIEEKDVIRELISTFLSKAGYAVITAVSGEEGYYLFLKGSFDLVLTDLTMPGMDGWMFARLIKKKSPDIPVGLMTGWGREEITSKMKGSSVDFVMFKPFALDELQDTIKPILEAKKSETQRSV